MQNFCGENILLGRARLRSVDSIKIFLKDTERFLLIRIEKVDGFFKKDNEPLGSVQWGEVLY
jgi:hypothetical protein